jgi:hypothetical protein
MTAPIPSGGMEMNLKLELHFKGPARLVCRLRELIVQCYSWDYNNNEQVEDQPQEDQDDIIL